MGGFTPPGGQNNPALLPLESDNFDLSLEYYFSDKGYVSLGAFQKNVENFIGNSVETINLYGIRNQTGGPRAQQALAFLRGQVATAIDDSALFTAVAMLEQPGHLHDAERQHGHRRPARTTTAATRSTWRSPPGTTSCRRPAIRCTRST